MDASKITVTKREDPWKKMKVTFIINLAAIFIFGVSATLQVVFMVRDEEFSFFRVLILTFMLGFASFTAMRTYEMAQTYGARMEHQGWMAGFQHAVGITDEDRST